MVPAFLPATSTCAQGLAATVTHPVPPAGGEGVGRDDVAVEVDGAEVDDVEVDDMEVDDDEPCLGGLGLGEALASPDALGPVGAAATGGCIVGGLVVAAGSGDPDGGGTAGLGCGEAATGTSGGGSVDVPSGESRSHDAAARTMAAAPPRSTATGNCDGRATRSVWV